MAIVKDSLIPVISPLFVLLSWYSVIEITIEYELIVIAQTRDVIQNTPKTTKMKTKLSSYNHNMLTQAW